MQRNDGWCLPHVLVHSGKSLNVYLADDKEVVVCCITESYNMLPLRWVGVFTHCNNCRQSESSLWNNRHTLRYNLYNALYNFTLTPKLFYGHSVRHSLWYNNIKLHSCFKYTSSVKIYYQLHVDFWKRWTIQWNTSLQPCH